MDELVEHWTVLDDGRELLAGKRGGTRLGFALLLKHYTRCSRFAWVPEEFPAEAVEFVAGQVQVPAEEFASYAFSGSTAEYYRAQIRAPGVPGVFGAGRGEADRVARGERRPRRA
jgi:hypothetical protein